LQQLTNLVARARADADGIGGGATSRVIPIQPALPLTASEGEVARILQICNACRYCEGFCAVFPAMTRRLEFGKADTHYLANLCHNCGACLHACQYAPPHEFAVNVPQAMAQVRMQTYRSGRRARALPGAGSGDLGLAAARAARGQFLRDLSAQLSRAGVRRGVSLRDVRAGHGRAALLARGIAVA
jgi:citrate/tricarballylate utilization protein